MSDDIKVSVIIPCYNGELYLDKCLQSVLNQTLKEIEIICINDCSTDKTLDVLKANANKDNRIKIINFEENKGVSIARNTGIESANGEYIGFVDCDDFIDLDFFEKLYSNSRGGTTDFVYGSVRTNKEKKRKPLEYLLYNFSCAIYNRTFLKKNSIQFPTDICVAEDNCFCFKATCCSDNYKAVENTFYYYIKADNFCHLNSILFNDKKVDEFIKSCFYRIDILNNNAINFPKKYYSCFFHILYDIYFCSTKTKKEGNLKKLALCFIQIFNKIKPQFKFQTLDFLESKIESDLLEGLLTEDVDIIVKYFSTKLKNYTPINQVFKIKLFFITLLSISRFKNKVKYKFLNFIPLFSKKVNNVVLKNNTTFTYKILELIRFEFVKGILQKRCREKHDRGKIIFAFEGGLADQFCHFLFAYYFSKKHREKKIYFFADTCSTKFGKEANVNHISGFKLLNYNIRDMMDFEMVSLSREELKYYGDNKLYRINYFGAYPLDSKYNISLKKVKDLKECLIKKAYFPPLTKKQQKRVSKIREKIKLITPLNSENLLKLEQIKNSNSVSLHIRRGDMSGVSSFVSKKYMEKAINKILTLTKWEKMTLFIFSQDDWIKNNLTYDANRVDVDFVNINSESEGYFDIELIRNCKHHITSVGSFSWLGTFLDKNKDKIVIYPDVNNKEDWEDYSKHKQVFF